jgi:curved DNA-binding protein CbpA
LPESNPYKLLQVSRSADNETIEEAYDRLFDKYEPRAQAGDAEAISMLESLNEAHDVLLDPVRRAQVDASLAGSNAKQPARTGTAQVAGSRTATAQRTAARPTNGRASTSGRYGSTSSRSSRQRAVAPARRQISPTIFVFGGVLLIIAVVLASYFIARGSTTTGGQLQPTPNLPNAANVAATATADAILNETFNIADQPTPAAIGGTSTSDPNKVVATVNNQPVYMYELTNRYVKDLIVAASDPLMGPLLAENTVTSTRMLDIISQDSLDKLINMQVIVQQAQKEGLYPSDAQVTQLVDQAKQQDLKGTPFPDFLSKNRITEQQYTNNVVRNVVYAVMASKHVPATGTDDEKQNAFINWMCTARKGYDVKVLLNFTQTNQPCSSGLPSDVPLTTLPPSDNGQGVPAPVETGTP